MARTRNPLAGRTVTTAEEFANLSVDVLSDSGFIGNLMLPTRGVNIHSTVSEMHHNGVRLAQIQRADEGQPKLPVEDELRDAGPYDPSFRQLWLAADKARREDADQRRFGL